MEVLCCLWPEVYVACVPIEIVICASWFVVYHAKAPE